MKKDKAEQMDSFERGIQEALAEMTPEARAKVEAYLTPAVRAKLGEKVAYLQLFFLVIMMIDEIDGHLRAILDKLRAINRRLKE